MKRLTLRMRLTALYGGLFFLAGAAMLGVTYLLVEASLDTRSLVPDGRFAALREADDNVRLRLPDGEEVDVAAALEAVQAAQEQFRADTLESVLTQGGIALLVVGAVALGLGWLLAGRALAPVNQITDTARRIASSAGRGLHERIALAGPQDEVRELADTFDTMLERLDRSFDGQRRLVANASHEIRTPLAINRALVELAITRPDASDEVKQLGESLLAVNARHERLIDGLLTLADSESEVTERSPVDLAEVAGHVLAAVVPAGMTVDRHLDTAHTTGDPILLERLVHNLVENAVRHNLPDARWLSVETHRSDGYVTLAVANTGPPVTSYEVPVLFEPFRRLDRAGADGRERGFGLGLSIVRAIARAHHGDVSATPRDGGGLEITVTLPTS